MKVTKCCMFEVLSDGPNWYSSPGRLTGFLWGQMKPFIRGKILFSPDTAVTRRIMGAVNATFSPIEGVRRMTRKWIDIYSERVRGLFLDTENQQFMKVVNIYLYTFL